VKDPTRMDSMGNLIPSRCIVECEMDQKDDSKGDSYSYRECGASEVIAGEMNQWRLASLGPGRCCK
jgi:hypothetical protein